MTRRIARKTQFRTYKRTIKKIKLSSRTVPLAHREPEVSLVALQIFVRLISRRGADGDVCN
jgi:hypothetical protein